MAGLLQHHSGVAANETSAPVSKVVPSAHSAQQGKMSCEDRANLRWSSCRACGHGGSLPATTNRWQWLEQTAREHFRRSCIREIRTPLLEATELFARGIGEATDVVGKEMYASTTAAIAPAPCGLKAPPAWCALLSNTDC